MHCVGLTFFTKQKYNNLIINEQHVYNTTIESFMHSYYTIYTIIDERAYKSHIFRVRSEIESKISFQFFSKKLKLSRRRRILLFCLCIYIFDVLWKKI